jgi:hypothetical protein
VKTRQLRCQCLYPTSILLARERVGRQIPVVITLRCTARHIRGPARGTPVRPHPTHQGHQCLPNLVAIREWPGQLIHLKNFHGEDASNFLGAASSGGSHPFADRRFRSAIDNRREGCDRRAERAHHRSQRQAAPVAASGCGSRERKGLERTQGGSRGTRGPSPSPAAGRACHQAADPGRPADRSIGCGPARPGHHERGQAGEVGQRQTPEGAVVDA